MSCFSSALEAAAAEVSSCFDASAVESCSATGAGAAAAAFPPSKGLLVSCASVKAVRNKLASARWHRRVHGSAQESWPVLDDPLTLGIGKANGESLGSGSAFTDVCRDVVNPGSIRTNIGRQGHLRSDWSKQTRISTGYPPSFLVLKLTVVVGANFQSLVSTHHQSNLFRLVVLQQANVTSTSLLPFR